MYKIEIARSALKELAKLPVKEARKVTKEIVKLEKEPRPRGCVKLTGSSNEYRIRIGNYRVLYTIQDRILKITVFKVGNRKDIY